MAGSAVRVGDILEEYAARGVFRTFSRGAGVRGGSGVVASRAQFQSRWHRNQVFHWQFDARRRSLRVPCVLPQVPARSSMYKELKAWLRQRQDPGLPEHRRCDAARLQLKTYNRGGTVALTALMLDDDLDYAVRKLVDLVNEVYLDFLSSGLYYDWQLETFDLDPDRPY
jgi:hypothetical protein